LAEEEVMKKTYSQGHALQIVGNLSGVVEFTRVVKPTLIQYEVSMRGMRIQMRFVQIVIVSMALTFVVHAQGRRTNRSTSLNVDNNGSVTNCSDIRVSYDHKPAITEESETSLPAAQVSTLRTRMSNGGTYVHGWDRAEYSVKTCKAAPADDPNAMSTLRDISTSNSNGELTVNGPSDHEWTANLILMVPRLSNLDLSSANGPLQVGDLAGVIHLNATNGPISINNVGGSVDAKTTNGPISLKGASGDQHLTANNGPVSVQLSGTRWDGPGLEVSTKNGPVSLSVPDGFSSGILVEASGHAPLNCRASICAGNTQPLTTPGVIRLGSGDPVVKLSAGNGPLSIH
jgi:hypothetical protein